MLIIAHRGASGYEPENTIKSFNKAIELKADMIELNVHMSKDREIIVMHDKKVNRTTNGIGYIYNLTHNDILELNSNGEAIPTLDRAIRVIEKRVPVIIELKDELSVNYVITLLEKFLVNGWSYHDFLVSSFDHILLRIIKARCPEIKTIANIYGFPISFPERLAIEKVADYIALDKDFINKTFVQRAHNCDFKVLVYTVNDLDDLQEVLKCGIDGIFTDFPDKIRQNL